MNNEVVIQSIEINEAELAMVVGGYTTWPTKH